MAIRAQKGTKDMLPGDAYKWQYIEREWNKICEEYGFEEIRTPVFEATELFNRGVGETTDIVQKEMYTFKDLGERSITLKPEGTASVVRAFIESRIYAETQPTKLYYDTACYRYEKPQSNRLREFHQFGIENFGSSSMIADAEIIDLGYEFLKRMGVKDLVLHISSVGCRECRPKYRKVLQDYLKPKFDQLCETCKSRFETNPMRILDCKSAEDKELVKDAPMMIDYLCEDCKSDLDQLKKNLDALGIEYQIDPKIVRGLDYYTKTAFEFITDKLGAQGTVCGGGRYDHLIEEVGGPEMPGVGFGLGKERLLSLMEECDALPPFEKGADVFLAFIGDEALSFALELTKELRQAGLRAEMDTQGRKLKGQMNYANKLGARFSIIIGEDEIKTGVLTVRDMATSSQESVAKDKVFDYIRSK